jgi:hypothetical protein
MLAFEVFVNRKKVCTSGIGNYGVMSSILSMVKKRGRRRRLWLEVGGLLTDGANGGESHVRWLGQKRISIGDEIKIKVLEADEVDPPIWEPECDRSGP